MAIGLGIVLLVAGLVFLLDVVTLDIPNVADETLGWVLLVAGVLAIVLSLVINQQRNRRTIVEERGYDAPRR
jgi:uncharacterized membrane protein HdeD (DUF308 family)